MPALKTPAPPKTVAPKAAPDPLLAPLPSNTPTTQPNAPPEAPVVPILETPPTGPGDIVGFTPAPLNLDGVNGPTGPRQPPAAPSREPTPPKEPPPVAPQPGEPTTEELERRKTDNSSLRKSIEEANQKRESAENELRQERERLQSIERERDDLRTKHETVEKEFTNFRTQVGAPDPMKDDRIMSINTKFDGDVNSLAEDISLDGGKGGDLRGMMPNLLSQFRKLGKSDSEGYEDRRDSLNEVIEQKFPEHTRDIRKLLASGVQMQDEINKRVQDLSQNGDKIRADREREHYSAVENAYKKRESGFFNPAPDVIENDPFSSEVLCTKLLEATDDTKAAKKQILDFCRSLALPMQPVDPDQMKKMTADEQNTYLQNRQQGHIARYDRLQMLLPTALASLRLFPGCYKRMIEAEKQLTEIRGAGPPAPTGESGSVDETPKTAKDFVPSNTKIGTV